MSMIFLISLPRSGSTLLQKILSSHSDIETEPETWFLLPLLGWVADLEINSSYSHRNFNIAKEDFLNKDRLKKYQEMLNQNTQYICSNQNKKFFLDKTPRYTLILKELIETFPDAKFIILARNPLSIINSIINTWGKKKRWLLRQYYFDLFLGLNNMIDVISQDYDNVLHLKYENLVSYPEETVKKIERFLGLKSISLDLNQSSLKLSNSSMGDKTGQLKYDKIDNDSVKRLDSITNIYRKKYLIFFIKHYGKTKISKLGYDYNILLDDLDNHKVGIRYLFRDFLESIFQMLKIIINLRRIRFKFLNNDKFYGELD